MYEPEGLCSRFKVTLVVGYLMDKNLFGLASDGQLARLSEPPSHHSNTNRLAA